MTSSKPRGNSTARPIEKPARRVGHPVPLNLYLCSVCGLLTDVQSADEHVQSCKESRANQADAVTPAYAV